MGKESKNEAFAGAFSEIYCRNDELGRQILYQL